MLNDKDLNQLKRLEDVQIKNDLFLRICVAYLNDCERLITKEMMEEMTAGEKSLDEFAFSSFLSSSFIEDAELEKEMHREYFFPSVKKLDANKYRENPYFKRIPITNEKTENWSLAYQKYEAYEGFVRDDFVLTDDFKEICSIGFFDEEFSYPTVFENGKEWMAIKPNEIETMKKPIEMAHGKVITFGLGMGYFAYMASLKDDVSEVTVVEKSREVISLFNSHILPHFENKDKIKIIQSDAFDYIENRMSGKAFDYAFVDLWRDTSDGCDLYIRAKKLEHLCPKTHFEYWIEKSILVSIRKQIFSAIIKSVKNGKNTLSYNEILSRLGFDYLKNFVKFL